MNMYAGSHVTAHTRTPLSSLNVSCLDPTMNHSHSHIYMCLNPIKSPMFTRSRALAFPLEFSWCACGLLICAFR